MSLKYALFMCYQCFCYAIRSDVLTTLQNTQYELTGGINVTYFWTAKRQPMKSRGLVEGIVA